MTTTQLLTGLGVLGMLATTSWAQDKETAPMQTKHTFERTVTRSVKLEYLLFLPKDYAAKPNDRWPVMLFLHGAGERGSDLTKVAVHGPPKLVKKQADFPFILISPQCPDNQSWNDDDVMALLDDVMGKYHTDPARVYVTGLSMGGFGTWSLASKHPERFAAVAPICGGGQIINILLSGKSKALKSLGVWAFHGGKDGVVPLDESERMVAALKKAGCADVQLTVYPEAGHDSWTEAYNNTKLYDWFLAHSRAQR